MVQAELERVNTTTGNLSEKSAEFQRQLGAISGLEERIGALEVATIANTKTLGQLPKTPSDPVRTLAEQAKKIADLETRIALLEKRK